MDGADYNLAALIRYLSFNKLLGYWPHDEECESQWKIQQQRQVAKVEWVITDVGYTVVNVIVFWQLFKLLVFTIPADLCAFLGFRSSPNSRCNT